MQNDPENPAWQDAPPSKTRRKHDMHELQDIGEQLLELNSGQIAGLNLPELLLDAVQEAKQLKKHGAYRRQLQYIGKLMRHVDVAPIREKLAAWNSVSVQFTARLHLLERWRNRLLDEDEALTELGKDYPVTDLQPLRTLVRNARKEKISGKPPRYFRELFQELQHIIPDTTGLNQHLPAETPEQPAN